MSEILRLYRTGITPQTSLSLHRGAFGRCISSSIGETLLILILLVVPCQPGLQLVEAYVFAPRLKEDLTNESAVVVSFIFTL